MEQTRYAAGQSSSQGESAGLLRNDAPWVLDSIQGDWAWNCRFVPMWFRPDADQMCLDMVRDPWTHYHWISRSGAPKVNIKLQGTFYVSRRSLQGTLLQQPDGPLLQIDWGDHSLPVRLAGRRLTGAWTTPHSYEWHDERLQRAQDYYASGVFSLDTRGSAGTAVITARNATGPSETWRISRSRHVGGVGAMSVFSPQRNRPAPPESLWLLPFPTANRQDWSLPLPAPRINPRTRRRLPSWDHVLCPGCTDKIHSWLKRHTILLVACTGFARDNKLDWIPDADFALIRKRHRPPLTLVFTKLDMLMATRDSQWFRLPDGSIEEKWANDGPILPGALNHEAARDEWRRNTPWLNASLFDNLQQGWQTPLAHSTGNLVVLRPYASKLFQMAGVWSQDCSDYSDPKSFTHMFTPQGMTLPSIPFTVAMRSSIEKPDRVPVEYRQIVDLSREVDAGPLHQYPSLNARLKSAEEEAQDPDPQLEMVRGVDIAMVIAVYQAFGVEVEVTTHDAKSYFHTFPVGFLRSTEQGILSTDGAGLSCVFDMGATDAPPKTGQFSAFLAECVGLAVHKALLQSDILRSNPAVRRMWEARSTQFGPLSWQARIAFTGMYSDDLVTVCPLGTGHTVDTVMGTKGSAVNQVMVRDKYGSACFIGFEYVLEHGGSMHIKSKKRDKYFASFTELASKDWLSIEAGDQLAGRLNYLATVALDIKAISAVLNDCRHAPSRMDYGFPLSNLAKEGIRIAARIVKNNAGIPLMADLWRPSHQDGNVISHRGDASLKEEGSEEEYAGWGVWWLVPSVTGAPAIYAVFDEWTPAEQLALGHDTPSAEALCIILGSRALRSAGLAQPHHKAVLQITDSESSALKFASLRAGSVRLDAIRAHWLELHAPPSLPAFLEHHPREYNVLADLISKGAWDLFVATLQATGLPAPTLLHMSPGDRNVDALIGATRALPPAA